MTTVMSKCDFQHLALSYNPSLAKVKDNPVSKIEVAGLSFISAFEEKIEAPITFV